ncbi:MAG TPA: hypothetical protein VHM24_14420, partial [Gemmatimonadaceae bacterium]|nr:hypothetical protein [Gemmatimonadaceae bacterium]
QSSPAAITTVGTGGKTQTIQIPKTHAEIEGLLQQREELARQLNNVSARRQELSTEIRTAPEGASRTGLEARLSVLDQRILQLETDIAGVGRQLSLAPGDLLAFSERANRQPSGGDFEEGMGAGVSMAVVFFAALWAFRWWRRRRNPSAKKTAAPLPMDSSRLERLEQGMEAIAIEIERVSEGQRFVTRLLSESPSRLGVSSRLSEAEPLEQAATRIP